MLGPEVGYTFNLDGQGRYHWRSDNWAKTLKEGIEESWGTTSIETSKHVSMSSIEVKMAEVDCIRVV